jgi:putative tricarboxylic transport membrane protein
MALLGMLLGTIGLDPITASPRFTYGTLTLADGLGLVPIIMGLFGISEVLLNIEKGVEQEVFDTRIKGLLPTREDWKRSAAPIARGSVLGFVLGILPASARSSRPSSPTRSSGGCPGTRSASAPA